jgi:hypothetical protein
MINQTNIRTFANLLAKVGTLKNPPADWKDMFFPEAAPTRAAE